MKRAFTFMILMSMSFVVMAEIRYYKELKLKVNDNITLTDKIKNLFQ